MKEALRDALDRDLTFLASRVRHFERELAHPAAMTEMAVGKTRQAIARTICTTLGITREMVRTKATNQWTIDILTALMDLAEGDT